VSKVWFHRIRAGIWLLIGAVSFPLGWASNVAIVWVASVYANVVSDWGASEAADDREIVDGIKGLAEQAAAHHAALTEAIDQLKETLMSQDRKPASQKTPSDTTYKGAAEGENFDGSTIEKTGKNKDHEQAVDDAQTGANGQPMQDPNQGR